MSEFYYDFFASFIKGLCLDDWFKSTGWTCTLVPAWAKNQLFFQKLQTCHAAGQIEESQRYNNMQAKLYQSMRHIRFSEF